MEITFAATYVSVESAGRDGVDVTVEAEGTVIAEQLSESDRLTHPINATEQDNE